MMLSDTLLEQYTERAEAEIEAGGRIDINTSLPEISIIMSDGSQYYFSDYEADELLNNVPDNICAEYFILALAQDW